MALKTVFENENSRSAVYDEDKLIGECDFSRQGDHWVIYHTEVDPQYGGKGLAWDLVKCAADQAASENMKLECTCSYAAKALGRRFVFGEGLLRAEITEVLEDGNRIARFECADSTNLFAALDEIGQMPLPPYITEKLKDKERYQTVYSNEIGSSAAPTAGLQSISHSRLPLCSTSRNSMNECVSSVSP